MSQMVGVTGAVGLCTGLAGAALVLRPRQIAAKVSGSGEPPHVSIVRVLGSRYLIQAVAETCRPTRGVLETSRAVDVLHALSMAAVVLAQPRYRNAAGASLGLALVSAAATSACLSRHRR